MAVWVVVGTDAVKSVVSVVGAALDAWFASEAGLGF